MEQTKYRVHFQDGHQYVVYSYMMAAALIIAQNKQIEKKKTIICTQIDEYQSKNNYIPYSPLTHFSAYPLKMKKTSQEAIEN
ncbi:MAG: hypothetical protein WC121_14260 [Candidatus Kapaibacterium sp.]